MRDRMCDTKAMFKCATAVTLVFGVLHAGSPFRAFPSQCVCFLDRKNLRHLTSARLTCMSRMHSFHKVDLKQAYNSYA